MNADNFAEWLRKQGHLVVRTESSYWYDAGPRVMQAFPYYWVIEPSEEEINTLLRRHNLLAARYSTPLHSPMGTVSYHIVYEEPEYTLETLDRRSRQNVRKGLRNCNVEAITFERLAEEGWELEKDTLDRQEREGQFDQESWYKRCMAAKEIPGFEAWGALVGDTLAATLLSFQDDDWCVLIFQQCRREFLNNRVNNALTYEVTRIMTERENINSVFYALHSLDAPPEIDEYKLRMNYIAKPVRQRVVFHPLIRPLMNPVSYRVVNWLQSKRPASHQLAKAEGMIRFYLQGKQPLGKQDWPVHLESNKSQILHEMVV